MPVFNIYSIGDSDFLEQIMIAVAMITGTGDFTRLVSVGLLLGVIMITTQSLIQGAKEINYQQVLIGWIMYGCFFGPSSTVTIEDGYTGQVRVVANVPIGVGFTGGVISSVGYKITKLFEQGYSVTTSITQKPFAEPLKILNETRRRTYDSAVFQALNETSGGGAVDFRKSWDNYIRECTLTKLDLGVITLEQMLKSPYQEAFRFTSSLFGTKLYLSPGSPNGEDYTCTDAWGPLINATGYVNSTQVQQALAPLLGIRSVGDTPMGKITDALTALGASSTNASNFIQMSLLEPLYFDAVMGKYQDVQDFTSAAMVNQAILQRNTQWAAEHSMFMTVVRPMMTFFEGFVYAITPIMAFLVVLGSAGIAMIGKYFQTVLWIQLWMPVLSVINLYIVTAANGDLSRFAMGGLNNLYALSGAGDRLDTWIATGGMLASATPVISLFIVTGSTYAFTTLASKVSGADHLNEKMATPDALQNGPVASMMPTFSGNQFSGLVREGTQGMMASGSFGGSVSAGVNSSQTKMQQAQQQYAETLGRSITDGASESTQFSRLASLGSTIGSMRTTQSQAVNSMAQDFQKQHGLSDTQTDAVKGALALHAAGSITTGKLGEMLAGISASGGVSGSAAKEATALSANKMDEIHKFATSAQFSKQDSQALTNQLAHQTSSASNNSFAKSWGDTSTRQLAAASTNVLSSADTYQTMAGLQQSLGAASNIDFKTLGGAVAQSPEAMKLLNDAINQSPQGGGVRQEASDLERRYMADGMSPDVARAAAGLTALTNINHHEPKDVAKNFLAAAEVASKATGRNLVPNSESFDPYKNAGLQPVENPGLNTTVGDAVRGAPNINDERSKKVRAAAGQGVGGPQQVHKHNARGSGEVSGVASNNFREASDRAFKGAADALVATSKSGENFKAVEMFGNAKAWGTAMEMGWAQFKDVADRLYGTSGTNTNFDAIRAEEYTRARNMGLSPAQSNLFAAPFSLNGSQVQAAADNVIKEYAEKDANGNPMYDGSGQLMMTEDNRKLADAVVSRIMFASQAGDQAKPLLNHVIQMNASQNGGGHGDYMHRNTQPNLGQFMP
ncbi:conjugal transfer protein TraG [Diaphorobacter sp. DS2]|nr:conjugal transfer protein TraG [Diaphorobacter sp. DS2]